MLGSLASVVASFGMAYVLTLLLYRTRTRWVVYDRPNERSLHTIPTPRGGGLAILAAGGAASLLASQGNPLVVADWRLLLGTMLVAIVSYLDDRLTLSAGLRFAAHGLAAGLVVAAGLRLQVLQLPGISWTLPGYLEVIVTILMIVWMTNLYNFMDGMDGFSGGMTVSGFFGMALLAYLQGDHGFALLSLVIAAASGGFLCHNFPPAKIFMGDVGSSSIGFLAAVLGLWAHQHAIFPIWIWGLLFSPFIVDASVTLMRRALQGERVWEAHRTHYYQRLVELGWSHRRTVLMEYVLMLACLASAVLALHISNTLQAMLLLLWVTIYALLMVSIQRKMD